MSADAAFREACEACLKREEAAKAMLPFDDNPRCPECRAWNPRKWQTICRGVGSFILSAATGRWWWKKPAVTFECGRGEGAPKHIHMQCVSCWSRWEMLTATETRKD